MLLKAKRDKSEASQEIGLEGLTDEPPQRLVSRLATWAGVAMLFMGAAIMAARTETGQQRIARLGAPQPAAVQVAQRSEPPRTVAADPLAIYETRRLADQVRLLAAEREQLTDRIAAMERTVGDVTASIPRDRVAAPSPESAPNRETPIPRQAIRVIETAPPPPRPSNVSSAETGGGATDGGAPATAPVPVPAPNAALTPSPGAQDSTAIRTEFGVDLAGESSIEALRTRWQQLRAQHGPILDGLRPVITVQEAASRPGSVELRLIVGPLSNANAATRLCATFSAAGVNCKPAAFDGQRLALR
ncbi:hypothetical protein E8L99_17415 [Phreatobacter aquaticus]|uniref:SPOR domain-containing protein n=1 Tax=Phreatobacter aquaticus TaxID=2570229 RepID=A0A4D7QIV4_9HYPH|nr:SPOR domain-containing protein [Phreatobacter aquaticus]QCK87408.1 hypothetical protein E8L99_17415 [Phreatobacter aquaticus]